MGNAMAAAATLPPDITAPHSPQDVQKPDVHGRNRGSWLLLASTQPIATTRLAPSLEIPRISPGSRRNMKTAIHWSMCVAAGLWGLAGPRLAAQQTPLPEPKTWTAAEDHGNMMEQLGIKALRPGPSGNEGAPNHANYDEATANPFPQLPEVLTLKNG
jgi:hypothetical protein